MSTPFFINKKGSEKMEKLSILDVVALAKAGYKPGEVKEIMAMANVTEEAAAPAPKESANPEPQKEPETPVASPEPDYKAMFEEQKKQVEELTSKLEAAQKTNIASDVSNNQTKVSTSETINNIFRSVLS